jgi:ferrous iron transport protein B
MSSCHDPVSVATLPRPAPEPAATPRRLVAVVGPPNSGKSTLFNRLTGLRQKVANYPGVTVEKRTGLARLTRGQQVQLVDLPGIYSLHPRSEDEQITHDVLTGRSAGLTRPDAIILILDATTLNRHLAIAGPIIALGVPTLVALNMADELRARGGEMDPNALAKQIGAPVALISARRGEGIEAVEEFLEGTLGVPPPVQLPVLQDVARCREWAAGIGHGSGYRAPAPPRWTRRLDAIFLHPVAGPAIFALIVIAVFQSIFTAATPLMDGIDSLISASGQWLSTTLPDSWIKDLLIKGIWAGVGSVIVFLPQILILFLFIGVLEDSGYLSRAAVIADRTMKKIGLQGKSFIPLLSAYACAVPAIMATRTIESKRDRIATILIAPFMTCSARLPVYTLVIAAFLPERPLLGPFLGTRAAAMIGLYVLGFAAAVVTAWVLKSSILRASQRVPFMLEMPPYRLPTLQSLGLRLYDRSRIFLRRAGTVILATTILLWCLASVPLMDGGPPPIAESLAGTIGRTLEPIVAPLGFNWKIAIGLITSLAAREVIVGTLGTIYGMENADEGSRSLQEALQQDLTFGGAVALLVFFAFALQCMSTVAVVRRETGGWKWPAIQFLYMLALAYTGALLANQWIGG